MKTLLLSGKTITTDLPCFVMGIINCTPDSFYEGGRGGLDRALSLIDEGADILDIGAESSRPSSFYVSEEEELRRIAGLVKAIRQKSGIPISIDTRRASVMEACYNEGADALNDISALEDDERCAALAAETGISVILMHKRGSPSSMQSDTSYRDVFGEVNAYLEKRAEYALSCGIKKEKIIVDPGIGFSKGEAENAALISRCGELCGGKYPVLVGVSRKSFIQKAIGCAPESDAALYGTITANIISALEGADILRVHDVAPCKDALAVLKSISNYGRLI